MKFNLAKLVSDLGGAREVAEKIGVGRTVPYGWLRRDYIGSTHLLLIKKSNPTLDLNIYFERGNNDRGNTIGST